MPYTIVSEVCEGAADCIPVCPVDCIHWTESGKTNEKGFKYPYIDHSTCIDWETDRKSTRLNSSH